MLQHFPKKTEVNGDVFEKYKNIFFLPPIQFSSHNPSLWKPRGPKQILKEVIYTFHTQFFNSICDIRASEDLENAG